MNLISNETRTDPFITGNRSDAKKLKVDPTKMTYKGEKICIEPLLKILEDNLRQNVVEAANDIANSGTSFADFGGTDAKTVTADDLPDWFLNRSEGISMGKMDCANAALLEETYGADLTLGKKAFKHIFPTVNDIRGVFKSVDSPEHMRNGDWAYFKNDSRYLDDSYHPGGAYQGENVIQVGDSSPHIFYGFGSGTQSADGWTNTLVEAFDVGLPTDMQYTPEQVKDGEDPDFVGFMGGHRQFLDVALIGMKIFDYRNAGN
jgi:hypothetical protein